MPTDEQITVHVATYVMGWRKLDHADYWADEDGDAISPLTWAPLVDWAAVGELLEWGRKHFEWDCVIGLNGCAKQVTCWIIDGIWGLAKQQNAVPEHGDKHLLGCWTTDEMPRAITMACFLASGGKHE